MPITSTLLSALLSIYNEGSFCALIVRMATPGRLVLTVDAEMQKLIKSLAQEFSEGNVSLYIRGLVIRHALEEQRPTGKADIPGWIVEQYKLSPQSRPSTIKSIKTKHQ